MEVQKKKKEIPNLVEKLDATSKSYKDNIAKNFLEEIREFIAQPGGGEYLDRRYEEMQKRKKEIKV